MTLLIDPAPIVALADPAEPEREAILDALTEETGALVIPAPTTAEIDHLLGQRFGARARRAFLADLAAGRFPDGNLERADYATIIDVSTRYASSISVSPTAHSSRWRPGIAPPASSASTNGTSALSRHCTARRSRSCRRHVTALPRCGSR